MREAASIILQLIRYANKNACNVDSLLPDLIARLHITSEEVNEIAEIRKADLRELNASYPSYEQLVRRLNRMGPGNPFGE